MNVKRICIAAVAGAGMLLPITLAAQIDPNGVGPSPYPQSPQGMNQPSNQPGSTSAVGAQTTPSGSMRDSLGAPGETGQKMLDKQFVRAAAADGIADVKLGTLATQKGGPEVKEAAQKMVDDHTMMNKDMGTVADALGVMLPKKMSKEDQAEYEKLNGLSGKDFDTEYLTYTVKAHWTALHSFYMESSAAADQELQAEVVKSMMTLRQHMGLISKAATAEGITLPPRPPRAPSATTAKK